MQFRNFEIKTLFLGSSTMLQITRYSRKIAKKMIFFGMEKKLAYRLKIDIFRAILDGIHYFFLQNIRN